jgi:hypothetical protein
MNTDIYLGQMKCVQFGSDMAANLSKAVDFNIKINFPIREINKVRDDIRGACHLIIYFSMQQKNHEYEY